MNRCMKLLNFVMIPFVLSSFYPQFKADNVSNQSWQVQGAWLNDSVQPEQLQAMVLAHLAEDSDVGAVLDEVVSDYGSSLSLRKIGQ